MIRTLSMKGKVENMDHTKIKKGILTILNKVEDAFYPSITEYEKEELLTRFTPSLRRIQTQSLQLTSSILIKDEASMMMSGEIDKDKLELIQFQQRLIELAIEERRVQAKKMPMERNYAEAPIFSASTPNASRLIKLRNEKGEIIEERVGYRKINFINEQGRYLTSYDYRVFGGLQRLWSIKGGSQKFSFSFKELCDEIDFTSQGGNYSEIADSLVRLSTTSIVMDDYEDPLLKKRVRTKVHNIIYDAEINRKYNNATIVINDYLQKGLEENNVVLINLSIYQDLSSITAKLLYPLLSSLLKENHEFDIDLLVQTIGLVNTERKQVIKTIREALDDLQQSGVIDEYALKRIGRPYKRVSIVPSQQLLDALEEGITLPKG